MNEKEYQEFFVKSVLNKNDEKINKIMEKIIPISHLSASKVIEIYSNDYKFRLLDALKSNFESIWWLLGDEDFQALAFEYIFHHPSAGHDLNEYGQEMNTFILKYFSHHPNAHLFSELAYFETQFWKTFHAKNPEQKNFSDISEQTLSHSTFISNHSIHLLSFSNDIFRIFTNRKKPIEEFKETNIIDKIQNPTNYLLFKKNHKVFCQNFSGDQFNFFKEIFESHISLTESLEKNISTLDDAKDLFKFIGENLLEHLVAIKSESSL